MALKIHNDIKNKLKILKSNKNIPNIIFYGPYGSGKRTLVEDFVSSLYDNNKEARKRN
jgi:DNA polymerase III delta prime subunit